MGKLAEKVEQEMAMVVEVEVRRVVMKFPVYMESDPYYSFDSEEARLLADALHELADEIDGMTAPRTMARVAKSLAAKAKEPEEDDGV